MEYTLANALMAMVSFSFVLMPITLFSRVSAVRSGKMKFSAFKLMKLEGATDLVLKTSRHWSNLFEVPTIFYALILLCLYLQLEDHVFQGLAWAFVIARFFHSLVHLTINNIHARLACFMASNIVLFIFLVRLFFAYQNKTSFAFAK